MCNGQNSKNRPEWFSKKKCFENLLSILDEDSHLTVLFDGIPEEDHYIHGHPYISIEGGTERKSYMSMFKFIIEKTNIDDNDIIYILEDDYMHKNDALCILREGFTTGADFVTLYDHPDKYNQGYFEIYANGFPTKVLCSKSSHWKTTPSTTCTYAMKFSTFKKTYVTQISYCTRKCQIYDHERFLDMCNQGYVLISPIPGRSTHCESEYISPLFKD